MPTPDTNGLPPFADFDMMKAKINEIVAKYNNLLVNLDSLNVIHLDAQTIDTGTLDANVVTIRSDLSGGAYVQIDGNGMVINNGSTNTFEADIDGNVTMTSATIRNDLSSAGYVQIDNDGIVINNGTFDTFTADSSGAVTMTSALIQSASGFPRVSMDPSGTLFGAFASSTDYLLISPTGPASTPSLELYNSDSAIVPRGAVYITEIIGVDYATFFGAEAIQITAPDVWINGPLRVNAYSSVTDGTTNLQTLLNAKATAGASTGSGGSASLNGGIPIGTQLAISGGGSVTWAGINVPAHDHPQT